MENEDYLVQQLNEQDKTFLKSKTPASLPDNPSDKRFSASQIKAKHYEGYLVLYEWIKRLIGQINTVNANFNYQIEQVQEYLGNPISVEDTDYVIPEELR